MASKITGPSDDLKDFIQMFIEEFEKQLKEFNEKAGVIKDSKMETVSEIAGGEAVGGATEFVANSATGKYEKIAAVFLHIEKKTLRHVLANAAGELFRCFEQQFVKISVSDWRGLEKLAKDGVDRAMHYINDNYNKLIFNQISSRLLARAVINGKSPGSKIYKTEGLGIDISPEWRTAYVYSQVGLYDLEKGKCYSSKKCNASTYGYRLLLSDETIPKGFTEDKCPKEFHYKLSLSLMKDCIEKVLTKMRYFDSENTEEKVTETSFKLTQRFLMKDYVRVVCKLKDFIQTFIKEFTKKLDDFKYEPRVRGDPKKSRIMTLAGTPKGEIAEILANAAGEVFRCFESQFMQISFSDNRDLEKLALDAADRAFDIFSTNYEQKPVEFSSKLLAKKIICSVTQEFKLPREQSYETTTPVESKTIDIFNRVGLCDIEKNKYYSGKQCNVLKYGYRLLLDDEVIPASFHEVQATTESQYRYYLTPDLLKIYIEEVITDIIKDDPEEMAVIIDRAVTEIERNVTKIRETVKKLTETQMKTGKRGLVRINRSIEKLRDGIKDLSYLTRNLTFFNVLRPVTAFTGRRNELLFLHNKFEEASKCIDSKKTVSTGVHFQSGSREQKFKLTSQSSLEGTSKTELPEKYGHKYFKDYGAKSQGTSISGLEEVSKTKLSDKHDSKYIGSAKMDRAESSLHCDSKEQESQAVSLCGLGGIGKSELARKYAHEYFKDDNAIWINSETMETLKASFYNVAEYLGIRTTEKFNEKKERDIHIIVRDVYERFKDRRYLLIFDNAENFNAIKNVMPWIILPTERRPQVLITSRCRNWNVRQEGEIQAIELTNFTNEEAEMFVKASLEIPKDNSLYNDHINKLCQVLDYFPLALSQATTYINDQNENRDECKKIYNIIDFIGEFNGHSKETKTEFLKYQSEYNRYAETIYSTWLITFKKFEEMGNIGQKALEIVKVMAYLAPDDIPIERYFVKKPDDRKLIRSAVEKLREYSVVQLDKGIGRVHRLVQAALRLWLEERAEVESVLKNALIIEFGSYSVLGHMFQLDGAHVVSLWSVVSKYESLVNQFIIKSSSAYRSGLVKLLASHDIHEAVRSIIECLKRNNIAHDQLRNLALDMAKKFGSENVIKYLNTCT